MHSFDTYLGSHNRVWDQYGFTGRSDLEVSEIWQCRRPGPTDSQRSTIHKNIPHDTTHDWLKSMSNASDERPSQKSTYACMRVVWVPLLTKERLWDVAPDTFTAITKSFGQEEAQASFCSASAGIKILSSSASHFRSGYLTSHPKLVVTWSQYSSLEPTNIICIAEQNKILGLRLLLDQDFVKDLAGHEMLMPLLAAILWSQEVERDLGAIKEIVRKVEVRTGHHNWKSRYEDAALGDLFTLSAEMSGCATKAASCTRKREILTIWNDSIASSLFAGRVRSDDDETVFQRFQSCVKTLHDRALMQRIDTEFTKHRVQIQLDAVSTRYREPFCE